MVFRAGAYPQQTPFPDDVKELRQLIAQTRLVVTRRFLDGQPELCFFRNVFFAGPSAELIA
jgi:hypothetical protein